MTIPLIENGKKPNEHLNVRLGLGLPADTPYGNLSLKFLKILIRLDHANIRIEELNNWFEKRKQMTEAEEFMSATTFSESLHIAEEIIFNIRRVTDELIGLIYLKGFYVQNNVYPQKLKIDSIGTYLSEQKTIPLEVLGDHLNFLEVLNTISNAHKHSFLNSDYNLTGREEPFVFALALKNNDLKNLPDFQAVPVRNLVEDFNLFYKKVTEALRGWS